MSNAFVHVELNTTDVDKAKAFYGKLFEWTLEDVPVGEMAYTMIKVGKGTAGGIMKHPVPGAPSSWLHQERQVAGRNGDERRHRSPGNGLAKHHHRSHRRRARHVAAKKNVMPLSGWVGPWPSQPPAAATSIPRTMPSKKCTIKTDHSALTC
jgi:catechol 2,3-dioxygenase-like lactoylglutathione lyase family enzyme